MSLLSRLQQILDPRSRRRREYPLHGLPAVLILAAAHGETSCGGCGNGENTGLPCCGDSSL